MTITTLEQAVDILAQARVCCPACGGTGHNRDASQAWDVPGAPVPPCPTCGGQEHVPAFPSCRRPCPCPHQRANDTSECGACRYDGCSCHGNGWTSHWPGIGPVLLDAQRLGLAVTLLLPRDAPASVRVDVRPDYWVGRVGPDPDTTVALALADAAQEETSHGQ